MSIFKYKEYCGPKGENQWVNNWISDFALFKKTCSEELPTEDTKNKVLVVQEIQDEFKDKSAEIIDEVIILNYYNKSLYHLYFYIKLLNNY